ncbi:MAG TPA: nucleotide exchange factor GrpE [Candidatus Binatia bacterium]|nr:nucleotide exchange factor GrpE [Candidatus Binatia bacterium]
MFLHRNLRSKNRTMSEETKKTNDGAAEATEENSPPATDSSEAIIADLKRQIEEKELEAKNNYDRFLRQAAELENFKKRALRERDELARFANESLIKDLLPVVDNLERAIAHAAGGGNGKPLVEGVEMVLKGLLDVLAKHGVTQISAAGQSFDPAKHEAMAQVESAAHEPNTVVEELHKGYMLHDRLLRPALVSVAKAMISQEKKNGQSKVENEPTDD